MTEGWKKGQGPAYTPPSNHQPHEWAMDDWPKQTVWSLGRLLDRAINRCKVMEAAMMRKENYLLEERRKRRNAERLLAELEERYERRGATVVRLKKRLQRSENPS